MRVWIIVGLLVLASSTARAQDVAPAAQPTEAVPVTPANTVMRLEDIRALALDEGDLERAVAELERLRGTVLAREELASALELAAYCHFGLEDEAGWTRDLQELGTLDPGRRLPSFYPLPLTRVLASFSATARSLVVQLSHQAFDDHLEVVAALLHDEARLLRRLVLRVRELGEQPTWRELDLSAGRLVMPTTAGAEIEVEALAFGPSEVELARSGVDLVTIPRHRELWEEEWFWVAVGIGAAIVGASVGVGAALASQARRVELTASWPSP